MFTMSVTRCQRDDAIITGDDGLLLIRRHADYGGARRGYRR